MPAHRLLRSVLFALVPALVLALPLTSCGGGGGGAAAGTESDADLVPSEFFIPAGCSEVNLLIEDQSSGISMSLRCLPDGSVGSAAGNGVLGDGSTYQQGTEAAISLSGTWDQSQYNSANSLNGFYMRAVPREQAAPVIELHDLSIAISGKEEGTASSDQNMILLGQIISGTLKYNGKEQFEIFTAGNKVTVTYTMQSR